MRLLTRALASPSLATALILGAPALGFGQAEGPAERSAVAFEVASVRADTNGGGIPLARIGILPGGQLRANADLRALIAFAYSLEPYQQVAGSQPLLDARFEVSARMPDGAPATPASIGASMRRLLIERFQLRARFEDQPQTVLVLRRAPGVPLGPHLKPSSEVCGAGPGGDQPTARRAPPEKCVVRLEDGRLRPTLMNVPGLARLLSRVGRRAVLDDTGLVGAFEIELTFNPATIGQTRYTSESLDRLPAFADAVKNELGLTMETERRAISRLVVERVEPPIEN